MNEDLKTVPNFLKFVFGGTAGMCAVLVIHPIDLVKYRMQMSGAGAVIRDHRTTFHHVRSIYVKEGFYAFYNGLSAALFRQCTYGSIRLGIYTWLFESYLKKHGGPPAAAFKGAFGMVAGGVSSLITTPSDVALIRMTTDGRLPFRLRRGYTNVFNALYRIGKEEGFWNLWRGCGPTVFRAIVVSAAQLGSYSQAKQSLLNSELVKDNIICHFCASLVCGFVTAVTCTPVDVIKTRIQSIQVNEGVSTAESRSAIAVLIQIIRKEKVTGLWKGFTPFYARVAPFAVLTFVVLEQLNRMYFKYVLDVEGGLVGL